MAKSLSLAFPFFKMLKFETTFLLFLLLFLGLLGAAQTMEVGGWVFAVLILFYLAVNVWGTVSICSGFHLKAICEGSKSENKIALTFDDGPDPELTPKILEVLDRHGVRGTFFCIGRKVFEHASTLKIIHEKGHIIGGHSFSHSSFFDFYSAHHIQKEFVATDQLVENNIGKKIALFRPPYGITTPNIKKAVSEMNYTVIGWNIRSMDTMIKNPQKLANIVIAKLKPGAIVLFHDTTPHLPEVLEQVLRHCNRQNLECVGVDELLKIKAYE